jgi:hypothetical protein
MGTWNAFYVGAGEASRAAILKRFPAASIEATDRFLGVRMPDDAFEAPEAVLAELSSHLGTDVIWLGFQSTVDAFLFHHWRSGEKLRSLVFGCFEEAVWERVEGQPEPWEPAVFFGADALAHQLEYADEDARRAELQRIWRENEILPGRSEPRLDARDCAHQIAAHFGFPHYGA